MFKLTTSALTIFIFLIITVTGFGFWLRSSVTTPHQHTRADDYITIEKGLSPKQIVSRLADEGIISSYTPTMLYLRLFLDGSKLQAGEYRFPSPISALDVLKELESGEERTTRLTIPEGFTRFDIAKRIAEKFPQDPPVGQAEILRLMDDVSLIRDIAPAARDLEGYMYPSTYSLPPASKPADIVKVLVEQFKKTWKPEWSAIAARQGRTPHEIVIIASLIETESAVAAERPVVASVIYNRLARGMALGIDQTAVYIAKMEGRWDGTIHRSDLESSSPYNTRRFSGLPPGPISSVSESSILAALNPAQTDNLYYVRNVELNDGSHWFYASAAEFEKGKAKYQAWLAQERREMQRNSDQ